MNIFYHEKAQEFHLQNESVSYIMKVLKNGQIGQLYYGSAIPDKEDFGYYIETMHRPMSSYLYIKTLCILKECQKIKIIYHFTKNMDFLLWKMVWQSRFVIMIMCIKY